MAEPQKKTAATASTVASCSASDCSHNENQECQAGSIEVRMTDGQATCATYDPEKPKARP